MAHKSSAEPEVLCRQWIVLPLTGCVLVASNIHRFDKLMASRHRSYTYVAGSLNCRTNTIYQGRACRAEWWVSISEGAVHASPCDAISVSESGPALVEIDGNIAIALHYHDSVR